MFVKDDNFPLLAVEKLLVHLTEYPELGDLELHPREMTQDGMSKAVGVSRPHAARVLKELYRRGLVDYKMAHIPGTMDRRRTYFLTDLGRREAARIGRIRAELSLAAPVVNEASVEQFRFGGRPSVCMPQERGPRPVALPR